MQADGRFLSDRTSDGPIMLRELLVIAQGSGQEITFTCVPPGAGQRMGIDRDEDGIPDRDEVDVGSNPADRLASHKPGVARGGS
jgi:hypothetical protein